MFAFIDLNVLAAANLLGIVLTRLGFLDQGRASVERAVARSRKVGNPYDRAQALCFATEVHLLQRDASAALEVADEAAALARENGFHSFLAVSQIYQHALRDGPPEDIRRLIDDRKRFGEHWNDSGFLAILAEQHLLRGAFEAASRCLDDALVRVRAGESYHEAEIYRLQGEVFFARASKGKPSMARNQRPRGRVPRPADVSQAEACFRRSIDIARSQQAKLLELRGAVSLGRLLESRRETRAARQIVGETLDWFREGLHATDLRDARTLLEQLAK